MAACGSNICSVLGLKGVPSLKAWHSRFVSFSQVSGAQLL